MVTNEQDPAFQKILQRLHAQPGQPAQQPPQGGQQQQAQQPNQQQQHAQAGGGGGQRGGGRQGGGGGNNQNPGGNANKFWNDLGRYGNLLIAIVATIGAVWYYTHDTPPRRAETEKMAYQEAIEKQKTEQKELDLQIAQTSAPVYEAPRPQPRAIPTPVTPPQGICVSPHPEHTKFEQPIVLTQGTCVQLSPASPAGEYFWARFQGLPSHVEGVKRFVVSKYTGTLTADGQKDLMPYDDCEGNCNNFLERHSTEPILVIQTVGQSLNIRM